MGVDHRVDGFLPGPVTSATSEFADDGDARYRILTEAMADMAYVFRIDGPTIAVEWVSPSAQSLTGWSAQELADPAGWLRMIHQDDHDIVVAAFADLAAGRPRVDETRFVTRDGEIVWFRTYAHPIPDPDGRVVRVYGAAQDVTQRRAMEAVLAETLRTGREIEERYRMVSEAVSDVAYSYRVVDGRMELEWTNAPAYARLTGIVLPDGATELWRPIVHPDDVHLEVEAEGGCVAGAPRTAELRIVRPDGETRWIRLYGRPVVDDRGAVVRVHGAAQDVTDRKVAEIALASSEASLKQAQAVAHVGSWDWDIVADEVTWSDELYRIYGLTRDTFVPTFRGYLEHVFPEDRDLVVRDLEGVFARDDAFEHEYRIVRPGGEVRWLSTRALTRRDDAGTPIAMTGVCWDVTERRRAEERYQVVTELVSDMAYVTRVDPVEGIVIEWATDSFERITGYSPEAFPGWGAIIPSDPPEHLHRFGDTVAALLAGEAVDTVGPIIRKDGRLRWIRAWARPVVDPQSGAITRVFGAAQDVTEQKEAELRLAANEDRLKQAQAVAHVGSWTLEFATEAIEWSDELYRIHGLSPDTFTPTLATCREVILPPDRAIVDRAAREAVEAGETRSFEARTRRPNGDVRWLFGRIDALRDDMGALTGLRGTSLDITEHHRQEERHAAVSELISDVAYGFGVVDGEAVPEWVTDSFARLTGYEDENAMDLFRRREELIHPEDVWRVRREIANALAGHADVCECRLVTRSGEVRWMRSYVRPVVDDETGRTVRIYGAAQDVTQRRRAEEALREAYHRERAAATELRRADRLKDEILSTVSHELRTPLTAIVGFASALTRYRDSIDTETRDELVGRLERNALEMGRMVERLLDFSSLQAGSVKVDLRPVPLADVVTRAIEANATSLLRHFVACDLPPGVVVAADPEAFLHVLGNLLTNAAKYAPEGSPITVEARLDGETVVVGVRDEGPGIPADSLPRLFDRFYRGPDQPSGQRGSGIGLAIVQSYVELMHGRVWVESEPGSGSTFWFSLPIAGRVRAGVGRVEAPVPR
jgi:PAS domain S-box-containing protein